LPFGLTFNSYTSGQENLYRFQGQEHQDETGWDSFKWRNADPALGRFFNVDPLAEKYVQWTPYAFSGNMVTAHRELEGLEPAQVNYNTGEVLLPGDQITHNVPVGFTPVNHPEPGRQAPETPGDKIARGAETTLFGVVGTVASGAYVAATEGAGAALGGAAAFTLSLGEIVIGITQMVDGINEYFTEEVSEQSEVVQQSSSLPGLVGYGIGSENAPLLDALGQFGPAPLSGGIGIVDAAKQLKQEKNVQNALNLYDSVNDLEGAVSETKNVITGEDDEDNP
tara:strand:- start:1200 stop:2042 length:843 start_codon:yes stop_codon:yes gene_type:complete